MLPINEQEAHTAVSNWRRNGTEVLRSVLTLLSFLPILALWEVLVDIKILNSVLLPAPTAIALEAIHLLILGNLVSNIIGSLQRVGIGLGFAAFLGIGLGLIVGLQPVLRKYLTPIISIARPIPPIAWIPLAILWFGLNNASAVFVVAVGAFFPIFINTVTGISLIDHLYLRVAYSLGAGNRLLITDVVIPAAMPNLLVGVREGIGMGWMSVIAAEMIGVHDGLGYSIQLNRTMLQTEAVIVSMLCIGIIGWGMSAAVEQVGRYLTRWDRDNLESHTTQ